MNTTAVLAAAQPWSAKTRVFRRLKKDTARVTEHFQRYNLGSSTYDEDYSRNYGLEYLDYLTREVRRIAERRPDLLLLPEFCLTPAVIAEPMPGIARNPNARADAAKLYAWSGELFIDWLCDTGKSTGVMIGASCFTVRRGRIFNTGLLADDKGELVLRYDKIHLPADELQTITPGSQHTVADTRLGRIGFSICYDVQFPEHHAMLARQGVQIVLHPSAGYILPDETDGMGQHRLRVRASDHFAALAYSCFAPENDWNPRESCVIGPNGDVLSCVRGKQAGVALASVNLPLKRAWPGDKPDAPDREALRRSLRRPDTYRLLLSKVKTELSHEVTKDTKKIRRSKLNAQNRPGRGASAMASRG